MSKNNTPQSQEAHLLSQTVANGMLDKKAENIMILDLSGFENAVADFFVICSGNSDTHLEAIQDSVKEMVERQFDQKPFGSEGRLKKEWLLLDYVDVVAHIFLKNTRANYQLENLWGDAPVTTINP